MDKYEYKVRANEIEELIRQGAYAEAAEIADTIDWRRVKSVMMLCKISDLYKINRRYEDARDMLLLAYERRPGGRTICYSLCELSIKMEEYVQAIEYYKEYVQAASSPTDTGRYILQYKLYEAQDVSLEERIAVLEKLKQCDYLPKWGYELAYLYHRVGLASRCVEECDEFIAWFGDGKYVIKAMELKMLHQPLSPQQQQKYDHRFDDLEVSPQIPAKEAHHSDAAGMGVVENADTLQSGEQWQTTAEGQDGNAAQNELGHTEQPDMENTKVLKDMQNQEAALQEDELDIHVKTMDVGQYNTINLQAELAEGLREILAEEQHSVKIQDPVTRTIMAPMMEAETGALDYPDEEEKEKKPQPLEEEMESSEVFFGETGEISSLQGTVVSDATAEIVMEQLRRENTVGTMSLQEETVQPVEKEERESVESAGAGSQRAVQPAETKERGLARSVETESPRPVQTVETTDTYVRTAGTKEVVYPHTMEVIHAEPPKSLANVLSQEADGQLSLVMPEKESIEKQITGQISLEDILAEWERMKKENQEKREEEVRQHVLQQTGSMFTEFEASVRDGLLEQLERGKSIEGIDEPAEEPAVLEQQEEEIDVIQEEDEVEELEEIKEEAAFEEVMEEVSEGEIKEEIIEEIDEEEPDGEVDWDAEPWEETSSEEEVIEEETEEAFEPEEGPAQEEEPEPEEGSAQEEEPEPEEEPAQEEEPEPEEEAAAEKPLEVVRDREKVRPLTREERELFAPFIQSRSAREQLVKAIDNISLAAYTGNVIITGEEGMDTFSLAKNMIREVQATDSNFSGKVAKISGKALNKKDVAATLEQLTNGALIISKASEMNNDTVHALHKTLQQESMGIVVVLEDTKRAIDKLLGMHEELRESFSARMDVEALSNDTLVAFGRQYAREREYSIDDFGMLALHTRIEDMQTIDHVVTVVEVKKMVDEAIRHANRKTLGHFFDILFAKRYDEEDMIILSEKDFV